MLLRRCGHSRAHSAGLALALALSALLSHPSAADAQGKPQPPTPPAPPAPPAPTIKVSDDVFFKIGILVQAWANFQEVPAIDDYTQEFFLRRIRFLFGGQLAKNVTFFLQTDNANLGRTTASTPGGKNLASFVVQDAVLTYNFKKNYFLDGGLILLPLSYNTTESATALLPLDYGSFSFLHAGPTATSVGRDLGFQARGYLAENRVEVRAGLYEGVRDATPTNPLRFTGRVMVNLLDPSARPFYYPGFYLTNKRILSIGGSLDVQSDYDAESGDVFVSYPLGSAAQLNGQFDFIQFDGGGLAPTLLDQKTYYSEAGVYLTKAKVMPFGRVEFQRFDDAANENGDNDRFQLGLTWFFRGNNGNIRGAWSRIHPKGVTATGADLPRSNQFTVQAQVFYY